MKQREAKKERCDEIERRWGLGHGERNRERGRTVNIASIGHCTFFFFPPFFRFGYEMLLLIEFFCWIGLDLIHFSFGFLDSLSKRFFVKFINMQKLSTVFCFLKLLTIEFPLLRCLGFFFDPFWKIDGFILFLWCFPLKLSYLVLTKTKQPVLSLFFLQFGMDYKKA